MSTSRRPYLLRAMHEWMLDNALTPHVVVDAGASDVEVPGQFVTDGRIVLNISLTATRGLSLGNDALDFSARFAGREHHVHVPMAAVLGIYARETGEGMLFGDDDAGPPDPGSGPGSDGAPRTDRGDERRGRLKVVK